MLRNRVQQEQMQDSAYVARRSGPNECMSEEPELTPFSANPATQPGTATDSAHAPDSRTAAQNEPQSPLPAHRHHVPQRIPRWLERAELFLRVLLRLYIGLAVCYAPWSHMFWDQNPLFLQFPTLGAYAANGAVRGIISGLGLLNLWIAFRDAIRHWDG
jgi:hypothetical protein